MIAGFKAMTSKRVNQLRGMPGEKLWQRNFHERIIRNEAELEKIRDYIMNNPANWNNDEENPAYSEQPA
jgi:REP element-mobilizing transposase RayT